VVYNAIVGWAAEEFRSTNAQLVGLHRLGVREDRLALRSAGRGVSPAQVTGQLVSIDNPHRRLPGNPGPRFPSERFLRDGTLAAETDSR
jgi:hypothetical protein